MHCYGSDPSSDPVLYDLAIALKIGIETENFENSSIVNQEILKEAISVPFTV